jgi:MoxR-like ATPase
VFTWPTKSSGIVIPAQDEADLDRIWDMHQAGDRQVVALRGPSGTGKTSLAYDLAARKGVGIAKIDGAGAVTFADWVGFQSATERNGATVTEWLPSGFIQAVRADGPMAGIPRIVLLDEVNRAESSGATNALIPCLDHTGSLYIADAGRAIPLDPTVMYVMTANMGGAYTGTIALDVALTNRVTHWVTMGYPSENVEVGIVTSRTGLDEGIARQLVKCAQAIREVAERGELAEGVGPRLVLMAARKIKAGFGPRSACMSTWAMAYSDEGGTTSEQGIVRSRIESAFRA